MTDHGGRSRTTNKFNEAKFYSNCKSSLPKESHNRSTTPMNFSFCYYNPYTNKISNDNYLNFISTSESRCCCSCHSVGRSLPVTTNEECKESKQNTKRKRRSDDSLSLFDQLPFTESNDFSKNFKRRYGPYTRKNPRYDSAISLDDTSLGVTNSPDESTDPLCEFSSSAQFDVGANISTSTRTSQGFEIPLDSGFSSFNTPVQFHYVGSSVPHPIDSGVPLKPVNQLNDDMEKKVLLISDEMKPNSSNLRKKVPSLPGTSSSGVLISGRKKIITPRRYILWKNFKSKPYISINRKNSATHFTNGNKFFRIYSQPNLSGKCYYDGNNSPINSSPHLLRKNNSLPNVGLIYYSPVKKKSQSKSNSQVKKCETASLEPNTYHFELKNVLHRCHHSFPSIPLAVEKHFDHPKLCPHSIQREYFSPIESKVRNSNPTEIWVNEADDRTMAKKEDKTAFSVPFQKFFFVSVFFFFSSTDVGKRCSGD